MSFKTLSAVLRGRWFIDKQYADQHLPLVLSLLNGKPVDLGASRTIDAYSDDSYRRPEGETEGEQYRVLAAYEKSGTVKVGRFSSFDNVPPGSVAIIPVNGPILKYGGQCGEPGSVHMTQWVQAADAAPNISAIVVMIDSPGGMVDGTATLADAIKACSKLTVGFVDDGMMASAAMWVGSACDELYASRSTDGVGSIGVVCTIADYAGYFEKEGIKLHEIYAPQSTEKNADYHQALKGNYEMVQADLKVLADSFIQTIKTNRKGRLNTEEKNPFKGAMYFADEALQIGLIDGIKSFEEMIAGIPQPKGNAPADKKNKTEQNSKTMFGKKQYPALSALKGKASNEVTAAEVEAVNTELEADGITGVMVISEADYTAAENTAAKVAGLEATVATLTAANKTLKEENDAFGSQAGEVRTTVGKVKEEAAAGGGTEKKVFAHNKYFDEAVAKIN